MSKKRYLKDAKGIPIARITPNIGLATPLATDHYGIDIVNSNTEKIDTEIGKLRKDLDGKSTDAKGTSFDNSTNGMKSTNVQSAIEEVNAKAKANEVSILSHGTRLTKLETELNGARLDLINSENSIINKLV